MAKIKIVGLFVFILSVILAILSLYISNQNKINTNTINIITQQKAYTQEISKNIFYIYKNKNISSVKIDEAINGFLSNMKNRDNTLKQIPSILIKNQSNKIMKLWDSFYLDVEKFLSLNKSKSVYKNILIEELLNNIYTKNQELLVEFDHLKQIHQIYFNDILNGYKNFQYILFTVLIILLIYLFTQVKVIISFISEFKSRSNKVIKNSSIKELTPLEQTSNNTDISKATENFNFLLNKINDSIKYSEHSIEHTTKSLQTVQDNIEEFLELLYMQNNDIDIELAKKEDAIIESLDELINLTSKLHRLKDDLNKLINTN